jgi:hypothetical protein
MKAKLIKKENNYYLTTEKQTSLCYHLGYKELLEVKGVGKKSGEVHHNKGWNKPDEVMFIDTEAKLSKQNCDEIFGVTDVEKLVFCEFPNGNINGETSIEQKIKQFAFKVGFNKAMELNKDKVFTLEDMMNCWNKALKFQEHKQTLGEYIHSLQQPNEIEVEIVMVECENPNCKNGTSSENGNDPILCKSCGGCGKSEKPKLDSEGCLVLTKKI